jgi:hypothetical protein
MSDRRKTYRYDLGYELPALDAETNLYVGIIKDISLDGMLLLSGHVPEDDELNLRIVLNNKDSFDVTVHKMWVEHHEHICKVGCQIVELSRKAMSSIRSIIGQSHENTHVRM